MTTQNYLGDIIYRNRLARDLTQDDYGVHYGVSGPAIFKFEKGYVRPSLALWLRMSKDADLPERRGVLLWLKSKLPKHYQDHVELQGAAAAESVKHYKSSKTGKKKGENYARIGDRVKMRDVAANDGSLPNGLRELMSDDELWSLYKPSGKEIEILRDLFGPLGRGSKDAFRDALRLIRDFSHS